MYRHAPTIALVLLVTMISPAASAVGITTYGAGLKSCKSYLTARQQDNGESAAFVDWLSGYFSGVNKTSTRRNNFFGLSDLKAAMAWLDDYCNARSQVPFAAAVGTLLLAGKPGPAAHSIDVTSYGSAGKSCESYLDAREQRDATYLDASAEFTNWLGGYLSGVNAMSLRTENVLGAAGLGDAVSWLQGYCQAHPVTSFGDAVDALLAAQQPRYASQPAPSR